MRRTGPLDAQTLPDPPALIHLRVGLNIALALKLLATSAVLPPDNFVYCIKDIFCLREAMNF